MPRAHAEHLDAEQRALVDGRGNALLAILSEACPDLEYVAHLVEHTEYGKWYLAFPPWRNGDLYVWTHRARM